MDLERLALDDASGLRAFVDQTGGGIFADGFLSIASIREDVTSLGGWEQWLPPGSRLFGCSAFGVLLTTHGQDEVWVTDTQYGEIVESDNSISDFLDLLATPASRDEVMRYPLFERWRKAVGGLAPTEVLCPVPALALGGEWSEDKLSAMSLPVYLSFTAQLFEIDEVEVIRRAW